MKMSLEWFCLPLLLLSTVMAQDVNWGFKVRCFVVHGEVICPGCNTRAGLSCPRVNPPIRSCENEFWQIPARTKQTTTTTSMVETTTPMATTETETETTESTVTTGKDIFDKHVGDVPATTPWDLELFLYQIIHEHPKRRTKRGDDNSCRWNGDCPCPLICCRTSEECEKKCMMGVRLPPPWGTG